MMTDPIADMLTRTRNALAARHERVQMPASRMKREVARILTVQRARALGLESQAQGTSAASDSSAEGKDE